MSAPGFWMAPRHLARPFESGAITLREFAFVQYIGLHREAEPDEHGVIEGVVFQQLRDVARLLRCENKTASRVLHTLADPQLALIGHDLRQGQRMPFRVWLGHRALYGSGTTSDIYLAENVRSDFGLGESEDEAQAGSGSALAVLSTSDSRAHARDTETTASSKERTGNGPELEQVIDDWASMEALADRLDELGIPEIARPTTDVGIGDAEPTAATRADQEQPR